MSSGIQKAAGCEYLSNSNSYNTSNELSLSSFTIVKTVKLLHRELQSLGLMIRLILTCYAALFPRKLPH